MMVDLQILAMQADLTRVCSFMLGRELSNRTYPEVGVPDSHHMLSHHRAATPRRSPSSLASTACTCSTSLIT